MKTLNLAILIAALSVGCSTARTKHTDHVMRIMVDPDSIDSDNYVQIEQALVESDKWTVVDRGNGFQALLKEQDNEHLHKANRFADREKWARWKKMYGVGGIVVAHNQCHFKGGWISTYMVCRQNLSIIDASSGEVISAITNEARGGREEDVTAFSWADAVDKLNIAYPTHFKENQDTARLETYRAAAAEDVKRGIAKEE